LSKDSRYTIKISGESGQGINSVGEIIASSLKNAGYYIFGYREYPSLIRGGYASYQIDFSDHKINSSCSMCDFLICLDRKSVHAYLTSVVENGVLLHTASKLILSKEESDYIADKGIHIEYVDAYQLARDIGGGSIIANMIMTGICWGYLGLEYKYLEEEVRRKFGDKPEFLEADLKGIEGGYTYKTQAPNCKLKLSPSKSRKDSKILTGNMAIGFGAISAGVRAYYAYPMTPASSILTFLADNYKETGMVVKQAEDEITAANMALGSMYAGTRSFTSTSGGGFDLMTETLSLAGITEVPFVVVIAQRPGPATGLPTWTAQGDLNLAVYSGHGEFPRCVISVSDVESAYLQIQNAFNISEELQIPVLIMTDKQVAESLFNVDELPNAIPIKRGLAKGDSIDETKPRYLDSDTGVSPRWVPGTSKLTYLSNSDEHNELGEVTEKSGGAKMMINKRLRKEVALKELVPEPKYYGPHNPKKVLVGWGSVKNTVLDVLNEFSSSDTGYLHFDFVFPLATSKLLELNEKSELVLIENNATAQLGKLIKGETGIDIKKKFLKYDGRPFFIEDILDILKEINAL